MAIGRRLVLVLVLNLLANALCRPAGAGAGAGAVRKRGADNNEVDSTESLVVNLPTNIGESDQSTTTAAAEPSTNALKVDESTNAPSDPKPVVLSAQTEDATPAPEVIKDIFGSPSSQQETDSESNDSRDDDSTTTTTTESSDDDDDDGDDDDDDSFESMNTAPSGGGSNIISLLKLAQAFFPSSSGAMLRNIFRDYVRRNFRGAFTFSPLEFGRRSDDYFGIMEKTGHTSHEFGLGNVDGRNIDTFDRRNDEFSRRSDDYGTDEYNFSISNEYGDIIHDIVHKSDEFIRRSDNIHRRADNLVNKADDLIRNNDALVHKSEDVNRKGTSTTLNEIDTDITVLRPPPPPLAHQEIESEEESGSDSEEENGSESESESDSNDSDDDDEPKDDNNAAEASVEDANDNGDDDDNDDDYDSNEPPEGGGGGGILGLIAGLSGGEDGESDLGSLLAAVSGIVANLSGDGVDINALIASGIGLFVGLLSEGEENVGGVLASYLLTSLDSLSGGGAKNNGAFFGTFLSKLIKGTSANQQGSDGGSGNVLAPVLNLKLDIFKAVIKFGTSLLGLASSSSSG